jgi:hypothetical protein
VDADEARQQEGGGMNIPDHSHLLTDEIIDIIERAHWQTAKSVEHVEGGQHQYVVIGWDRDDLSRDEFWLLANTIRTHGRLEEWTPPEGFYDSGNRRPVRNRYLYVGEYAMWFTHPRRSIPMLNREHVAVQAKTPTRRVVGTQDQQPKRLPDQLPPDQLSFDS